MHLNTRFVIAAFLLLTAVASRAQWSLNYQTPNHEIIKSLSAPNDNTCWFVTNFANVYRTANGGTTWAMVPSAPPYFLPYGLFVMDDLVAFKASSTSLYKTIDGGATWNSVFSGTGSLPPVLRMTSSTTGVLTKNGILYKTTDGGDTWSTTGITQPPLAITGSTGRGVIDAHHDSLWVTQVNDGIAFSPDLGTTWTTPANNGLTFGTTPHISFADANLGMAVMHSDPFVFVTTDGGNNWTMADNSLGANEDVLAVGSECWYIPNPADHFYIKYSADSGATWTQQLFDANGFDALERSREGHTLWAGTDIGELYKYDNGIALGAAERAATNALNVSPNPFSEQLHVSSAASRFRVLTLAGQEVLSGTVINGSITTHALAQGVYVLDVFDASRRSIGRCVVIKQ